MNPYFPHLLSPLQVGNTILKNRMICPPSEPHHAQAGENWPSDSLIACYAERAKGGAAIVTCDGNSFGTRPGGNGWDASDPDAQNYMAQMADAVHFYGARAHGVIMMFAPMGQDASANVPQIRMMPGSKATLTSDKTEIPTEDLYALIEKYSDLAKHMADCGFDGTYIHMSYRMVLPGRMLSPITNHRTDEFGGSFENRIRFSLLLCKRIKEKCGRNFTIEASISGHDIEPDGWSLDDTVNFAKAAEGLIDILTIRSMELDNQHPTGFAKSATPFLYMAEHIKKAGVKIAVAASAGFFDPNDCEKAIAEGKADLISMARAFVSNPNYGRLLYEGKQDEIIPCLRCNKCHSPNHNLTVCVVNPRFGSEKLIDKLTVPAGAAKNIAIVGGGPAGMKCAITAADRGHKVTIFEKNDHLGGMIDHSRYASFKWPMLRLLQYFERKCMENPSITVHLDHAPEAQELEGYDVVVAAVGSQPIVPPIPGIQAAIPATKAFGHEEFVAENVVIIGGGEIGVETGLHLAQKGKKVTIIEMKDVVAEEAKRVHYYNMFIDAVEEYSDSLKIILKATCTGISEKVVSYKDEDGKEHTIPAGTVLLAAGMKADVSTAMQYAGCGKQFYTIGDCGQMGNLQTAIRSGYTIANSI
jgi:2,4-dienoyl-CoA reductase-like NADH-dependent reductase (Old Yellow Enzyme family)/thioredoxin reductase